MAKHVWNSWPVNVVGSILLIIGAADFAVRKGNLGTQATALILVGALLFILPVEGLLDRLSTLKVAGVEMLLENMKLPPSARAELNGLTSNDIWALNTIAEGNKPGHTIISEMNAAMKVATLTLIESQLVEIVQVGQIRKVKVTELGGSILRTASKMLP